MLRVEAATVSVGGVELLVDASLHVRPGDKVGLVGRNGSGKTTLLRVVAGEEGLDASAPHLDHGRIVLRPDVVVGYLPQTAVSGSTKTVWDEARSRMSTMEALQAAVERARVAVEAEEPRAIERLDEAMESFRIAGGYAVEERIGEVLFGLGFGPDAWKRTCDTFSGGWQMRIALARLLLSEPNLLLLDEPTNHLDLHARSWLAGFLERYRHAVVVVSHDRHLLDRVCKRIVEVRGGHLDAYTGNFGHWLVERELRIAQQQKAFDAQKEEREKLRLFVERFKYKPSKAAQAMNRQKRLDDMELVDEPEREGLPRLRLPEAPPGPVEAVELRKATLGFDKPVLSDVNLVLERGMRIAVLGPNGSGKSTLLRSLAGMLPLLAGQRRVGKDVRIGTFTQDLAQDLPADVSALDHVLSVAPRALPGQVRGALGALGLQGDQALLPIGSLSGGEKARVALSGFAVQAHSVLLLDEPTNHLDAVTVDVLCSALRAFDGALLVSTHDRFLVEQVATHVLRIRDGRLEMHEGVFDEDFEPETLRAARDAAGGAGADDHATRKRKARERERALRRIDAIHVEIEAAETRIRAIDERMFEVAADYQQASALAAERKARETELEALFAEWEGLEALDGKAEL